MKQLKPILHGRDHALGGPDPIPGLNGGGGGALEWEDVGTSGAGPVFAWRPRFLSLAKYTYSEITGTLNYVNFHARAPGDIGYTPSFITNDYPAGEGYGDMGWVSGGPPAQLPFDTAWQSDHFKSDGASDPTTAFQIKRISGLYLIEVSAYIYTGTTGDFHAWAQLEGLSEPETDTVNFGAVNLRTRVTLNNEDDPRPMLHLQTLALLRAGSGSLPVRLLMKQDSGGTSNNGPSTVWIRVVRLDLPNT